MDLERGIEKKRLMEIGNRPQMNHPFFTKKIRNVSGQLTTFCLKVFVCVCVCVCILACLYVIKIKQ